MAPPPAARSRGRHAPDDAETGGPCREARIAAAGLLGLHVLIGLVFIVVGLSPLSLWSLLVLLWIPLARKLALGSRSARRTTLIGAGIISSFGLLLLGLVVGLSRLVGAEAAQLFDVTGVQATLAGRTALFAAIFALLIGRGSLRKAQLVGVAGGLVAVLAGALSIGRLPAQRRLAEQAAQEEARFQLTPEQQAQMEENLRKAFEQMAREQKPDH